MCLYQLSCLIGSFHVALVDIMSIQQLSPTFSNGHESGGRHVPSSLVTSVNMLSNAAE